MIRLHLTAEGQTEARFVKDVLGPHLAAFDVIVGTPRFTGGLRKHGHVPRGGMARRGFAREVENIRRWTLEDRNTDARFTTMIDLYALPGDFPGSAEASRETDPYRRVEILQLHLAQAVNDRRFVPYIQLHEFEALVLCKPQKFGLLFEGDSTHVDRLAAEVADFDSPELIDEGELTHPAARIRRLFPGYDKVVHGPLILHDIGVEVLRGMCPHFARWLGSLERLNSKP